MGGLALHRVITIVNRRQLISPSACTRAFLPYIDVNYE